MLNFREEEASEFVIYDESDNRVVAITTEFLDALAIVHAVNKVTSEYLKQLEESLM